MVRIRTCLLGSAGALAAGLFWSGSALAFCNEVAASTPNGYDPAEAGCFNPVTDAGVQVPSLFWRNMCVSYSLQQDASIFVTLKQATDVAAQAFETWHNAPCDDAGGTPSIQAYDFGPVMCDQTPSNEHNNPIIFRDSSWGTDQANALGLTTLTVVPRTGELLGAAIEINASRVPLVVNTDAGIPDGAYDLQSIITHEAGHFLGLAHSQHTDAVMYAYYHAGQSALTPDDINGICPFTRRTARATRPWAPSARTTAIPSRRSASCPPAGKTTRACSSRGAARSKAAATPSAPPTTARSGAARTRAGRARRLPA